MTLTQAYAEQGDWPAEIPPREMTERELAESIVERTCGLMRCSPGELLGPSRAQHIVNARMMAVYLTRSLTTWSFPEIGRFFGRDHSTCIHARNLIWRRMAGNPGFKGLVEGLRDVITESLLGLVRAKPPERITVRHRELPPREYLLDCFDYNGALFWRPRPRNHFGTEGDYHRWNCQFAGRKAGDRDGRTSRASRGARVYISGHSFAVARVIAALEVERCTCGLSLTECQSRPHASISAHETKGREL